MCYALFSLTLIFFFDALMMSRHTLIDARYFRFRDDYAAMMIFSPLPSLHAMLRCFVSIRCRLTFADYFHDSAFAFSPCRHVFFFRYCRYVTTLPRHMLMMFRRVIIFISIIFHDATITLSFTFSFISPSLSIFLLMLPRYAAFRCRHAAA